MFGPGWGSTDWGKISELSGNPPGFTTPIQSKGQPWFVCQLHLFLDWEALLIVIHILVTSRLDYCNTLYTTLPLRNIGMLQLVQKCSTGSLMVLFFPRIHETSVSCTGYQCASECNWLPLKLCGLGQFTGAGPFLLSCYYPSYLVRQIGSRSCPQGVLTDGEENLFCHGAHTLEYHWNSYHFKIRLALSLLDFLKALKMWF